MVFDPDIHHRRSLRLKNYDYSRAGAYFVTICTQNRECLFGDVVEDQMRLNEAGRMVEQCWQALPGHFGDIELDEFVVMPNHFHGIIFITGVGDVRAGLVPAHNAHVAGAGDVGAGLVPALERGDHGQGDHKQGDHKGRPYGGNDVNRATAGRAPTYRAPTRGAPTGVMT